MIREQILKQINSAILELGVEGSKIQLEVPTDLSHGDYTTNIAFQLSKILKTSPMQIAQEISSKLNEKPIDEIEKIEAVNPGFINFTIAKKELVRNMNQVLVDKENLYKSIKTKEPRIIIVEYSSPNIAKPFTIGHLRSTIIGDAVANLLEVVGHTVKRDNHIGDWGTQFGKQIYAIKNIHLPYIEYPEGENIGKRNEQEIENAERPVKVLVDLYVQFHTEAKDNPQMEDKAREWFKKLEEGDIEARRLWQRCIEWSWKEFRAIYDELHVTFTENGGEGFGESFVEEKMAAVIDELREKKLLTDSEGAKIVLFPDEKYPPLLIIKKDGATLYATRDLAMDKYRLDTYGKNITIINEVGAEQSLYFQQLYEVERMLGWFNPKQRVHIKHGMYRFKDSKMSTRKGNVIWLEDVLEEANKKAHALMTRSHEITWGEDYVETRSKDRTPTLKMSKIINSYRLIGIGALKWNDLKRSSHLDITFDWDDILNMQGNSGPYIQYSYARTQSILEKSQESSHHSEIELDRLLSNKSHYEIEEYSLLRQIYQFPEVVQKAAESCSPNVICEYLFTLAQEFNLFYQKHRIIDASEEVDQIFRLRLTQSVGEVIQEGLRLLGIAAPREM